MLRQSREPLHASKNKTAGTHSSRVSAGGFSMLSSAFCLLSSVRYGRAGKTPCMAIQKFTVRNGIMLLCGKLPPAG